MMPCFDFPSSRFFSAMLVLIFMSLLSSSSAAESCPVNRDTLLRVAPSNDALKQTCRRALRGAASPSLLPHKSTFRLRFPYCSNLPPRGCPVECLCTIANWFQTGGAAQNVSVPYTRGVQQACALSVLPRLYSAGLTTDSLERLVACDQPPSAYSCFTPANVG